MPTKKNKVVAQAHYWDPDKKKTIWKRHYTIPKKYGGDLERLKDDLNEWRNENLIRVKAPEAVLIRKNKPEVNDLYEIKKDEQELKDPQDTQDITELANQDEPELKDKPLIPTILKTKFELKIPPLSETGASTVLFGASKSGKTTLMKSIIKKFYDNNDCITILIADNSHSNIYHDIGKKIIKTDKFDNELIKGLHRIQKKTNNKCHFCIVLDDMILDKNDPDLLRLILTLRNSKISTLCLLQSPTLLSKNARFNGNNFIFKRTNNAENTTEILEKFLSGYPPFYGLSKADQVNMYRDLTKDYGFIYLDALNDTVTLHNK